jgi:PIN domain nuclease of toxin-antitoxin system
MPSSGGARTAHVWARTRAGGLHRRARSSSASRSAWEAAIKIALCKLRLPESFEAGVVASRFDKLPIDFSHAEAVTALPRHHNDPFDRMLIVQAMSERLTLVTHDRRFAPYGIDVVWT